MLFLRQELGIVVFIFLLALPCGAMVPFSFWRSTNQLDPSWTPQWASLKAYWRMDGSGSIASGGVLSDYFATSDGTATGAGLSYATAKMHQGVTMNGTQYFTVPKTAPWNVCSNISVMFWVKWNAPSSPGWQGIISNSTNTCTVDPAWTLVQQNTSKNIQLTINTSAVSDCQLNTTNTPLDGNWHHIVFTLASDGTMKFYVDGSLHVNRSCAIGGGVCSSTQNLSIGSTACGGPITNGGMMDEISVFSSILSGSEILTIYNRQKNGP